MTRDERKKIFRRAEANMELEGFDPCAIPLYQTLKDRILAGDMTAREARDEVIRICTNHVEAA